MPNTPTPVWLSTWVLVITQPIVIHIFWAIWFLAMRAVIIGQLPRST